MIQLMKWLVRQTPGYRFWEAEQMKERIQTEANARFPEEACGFVLSGRQVVVCENAAEDPLQSFLIDPDEAERWWLTGGVTAVWHSHCAAPAIPSGDDEALAVPWLECWIYSVPDEDLGIYLPDSDGRLQLLRME